MKLLLRIICLIICLAALSCAAQDTYTNGTSVRVEVSDAVYNMGKTAWRASGATNVAFLAWFTSTLTNTIPSAWSTNYSVVTNVVDEVPVLSTNAVVTVTAWSTNVTHPRLRMCCRVGGGLLDGRRTSTYLLQEGQRTSFSSSEVF